MSNKLAPGQLAIGWPLANAQEVVFPEKFLQIFVTLVKNHSTRVIAELLITMHAGQTTVLGRFTCFPREKACEIQRWLSEMRKFAACIALFIPTSFDSFF